MKSSLLFSVVLFNLFLISGNAMSNIGEVKYSSLSLTGVQFKADEILQTDLIYFSATQNDKEIVINWKTLKESNNAFFTVEKSKDGQNFEVLTTENGAGTIQSEREYYTVDFLP